MIDRKKKESLLKRMRNELEENSKEMHKLTIKTTKEIEDHFNKNKEQRKHYTLCGFFLDNRL